MKIILKAVSAVLILASAALAQNVPIQVLVQADSSSQESHEIASRVASQIGMSSRYALLTNTVGNHERRVVLDIACMNVDFGGRTVGIVCHSHIKYSPWLKQGSFLDVPIDGVMARGDEASVAQDVVENFVQQTTDENLAKCESFHRVLVNMTIFQNPDGIKP
jgi:hypothetical protein